jgi:hypothetical protein
MPPLFCDISLFYASADAYAMLIPPCRYAPLFAAMPRFSLRFATPLPRCCLYAAVFAIRHFMPHAAISISITLAACDSGLMPFRHYAGFHAAAISPAAAAIFAFRCRFAGRFAAFLLLSC